MGEQPISLIMSETNIEKWGWSEFNSQYDSLLLSLIFTFSIIISTSSITLSHPFHSIHLHSRIIQSLFHFLPFFPFCHLFNTIWWILYQCIQYLIHYAFCTLFDNQIFMHVTNLLHYYSIKKVKLVLFHYFPIIFSFNTRLFIMYIDFYIDYYDKCNCTILNQNSHPKWTNYVISTNR